MTDLPLLPYTRHHITDADRAAVAATLREDRPLTQGPEVEAFEDALCRVAQTKYAVAMSNGTAALQAMYACGGCGAYPGRLQLPAISFVATANAMMFLGHNIEFVDWGLRSHVGVSIGGDVADREEPLLDLAHAVGVPMPPTARMATYSFHGAKQVTCGEGGAVVTNEPATAEALRQYRSHGRIAGQQVSFGLNLRMAEMNAALGRSQLARIATTLAARRAMYGRYATLCEMQQIPYRPHTAQSAHHLFQLHADTPTQREQWRAHFAHLHLDTAIHYQPIPLQPWWQASGGSTADHFPRAVDFAARILSIPFFPSMTEAEEARVHAALRTLPL